MYKPFPKHTAASCLDDAEEQQFRFLMWWWIWF